MKVTKKHIRLVGYVGLCGASYALTMFIMGSIFGVQSYHLKIDDRIVPSLNAQLAAHIQTLPSGVRVAPDLSAQAIQKQFPWVKSVSLFRIPTKIMQVAVAVDEPQVKINAFIITDHLRVLPVSTFIPSALSALPSLQVTFLNAESNIPPAFIPHAQTFTDERFSPYTLTWIDEFQARLTDKEQPQFTILFNAHSIPDTAMFAHCSSIKKLLEERGSFAGRHKGTRWVADVRFERQVILFSEKGGITHG